MDGLPQFVSTFAHWWAFGWFLLWGTTNKAVVNIYVGFHRNICFHILWAKCPGVKFLGCIVVTFCFLQEMSSHFQSSCVIFTFPLAVRK